MYILHKLRSSVQYYIANINIMYSYVIKSVIQGYFLLTLGIRSIYNSKLTNVNLLSTLPTFKGLSKYSIINTYLIDCQLSCLPVKLKAECMD